MARTVEINGVKFQSKTGVLYRSNYYKIVDDILSKKVDMLRLYRTAILEDLWFLVFFVLRYSWANNAFTVERCKEVQTGPDSETEDIWARGHGKAVDVDEPVPTPDGWRRHGDLRVGDYVFDDAGRPTRVIYRSPVWTDKPCYRVTFADHYSVVVSGDHLWYVGKKSRRRISKTKYRRQYRDWAVIDTETLSRHNHAPDKRYSVPLSPCVQYSTQRLPIDPYVLGAWLGDGNCSGAVMTCAGDTEIMDAFSRAGFDVRKRSAKYTWGVRGLQKPLRLAGLLKNKHIPEIYLRSDENQRFELLRGLMDTDGTVDTRGTATFSVVNERLARDTFELAASLGLAPYFRSRRGKYKGEPFSYYEVSFQAYLAKHVFSLPRKLNRCREGGRLFRSKVITAVTPVESRAVSCVRVESPNGLYLIGKHFTPTHNTSIITIARTIQKLMKEPERTFGIMSYAKTPAQKILFVIKSAFEENDLLKACFPDVLYRDPVRESPRWGMDAGIVVRRKGYVKEASIEAHGLIDGMPTGSHFSDIIYDDIETEDLIRNPDIMEDVKQKFEISKSLGIDGGTRKVIGTYYSHLGPLAYIRDLRKSDGSPLFTLRQYPATHNGEYNGKPVFFSKEYLETLKVDQRTFNTQYLCNPTPSSKRPLVGDIQLIKRKDLPSRLIKFMPVDTAGERRADKRVGDSWALGVIGVEPYYEDITGSNIYILDLLIEPLNEVEAIQQVVDMYLRNGRVERLGIEKSSLSTFETHVSLALKSRGRQVSLEIGNLMLLRPAGRRKEQRIEKALAWPMANGKVFMCDDIPSAYRQRLLTEIDQFPYWHDDGVDMLSYTYDMIGDFPFSRFRQQEEPKPMTLSEKLKARRAKNSRSWLLA